MITAPSATRYDAKWTRFDKRQPLVMLFPKTRTEDPGCGRRAARKGRSGMKTIRGPGLFLAQYARKTEPHSTLDGTARCAEHYG